MHCTNPHFTYLLTYLLGLQIHIYFLYFRCCCVSWSAPLVVSVACSSSRCRSRSSSTTSPTTTATSADETRPSSGARPSTGPAATAASSASPTGAPHFPRRPNRGEKTYRPPLRLRLLLILTKSKPKVKLSGRREFQETEILKASRRSLLIC